MSTETQTAVGKFVWHDHQSKDVEKAKSFYTELLDGIWRRSIPTV